MLRLALTSNGLTHEITLTYSFVFIRLAADLHLTENETKQLQDNSVLNINKGLHQHHT